MPPFGPGTRAAHGVPKAAKSLPSVGGFEDGVGTTFPLPYTVRGVTKDSTGAVLASCDVHVFRTTDDSPAARGTSNASGDYRFDASAAVTHYIVAYKAGSPDVTGATVNTLVGTPD